MTHEEYLHKVERAKRIVFFGGAGVSTESGIPDFRSVDGLYSQKYDVPPEELLSHEYFWAHTDRFYKFYFDKMICPSAKPNAAHKKLAEWEKAGKLIAVITQNIDGLHQAAGSERVYELHGTVHSNHCTRCNRHYTLSDIMPAAPNVPHCECGGIIKPDVVLYNESLPESAVNGAISAIRAADMMIVGGTSLAVYPANGLVRYFRGDPDDLVCINLTPLSGFDNSLIGKLGELL